MRYVVATGDTFDTISRKILGGEGGAGVIASANPGVLEPLAPGTYIVVPTPRNSTRVEQTPSTAKDEVAIIIGGQRFRFWSSVRITTGVDAIDEVNLQAPFDADAPGFKESFRPFSYQGMSVTVGGEALFTGTVVTIDPSVASTKTISASGYALPGVLNDCTPPASAYPLEFNNIGLKDIAERLAAPFGVPVTFEADQGAIFERVACEPGKRILAFLSELAQQRNLVISSSAQGELLFRQSAPTGAPVAVLNQGSAPLLSCIPLFSPQEYYSHITGLEPVVVGLGGSQYTVANPLLRGVLRPLTFTSPDAQDAGIKAAVEAKAGRMFGNMASYTVEVATWRDPQGKMWAPNTTLMLTAPDAMIYAAYEFIIRSVTFHRDSASATAILDLVMPGSFSGKIPEVLPWDA